MSEMTLYRHGQREPLAQSSDHATIAEQLERIGVRFERWEATGALPDGSSQDEIIEAYRESIDRLMQAHGLQSVDVVSLTPDHPQRDELRNKFLAEHVHDDFEIRFFVAGQGLFYLRPNDDDVIAVRCEAGDLISVPAGVRHWFDMGAQPRFTCIRLFTTPEGWVARFTGDPIAGDYPLLDAA